MKRIASRDNPTYKDLRDLVRDHRRQRREKQAILEGTHLVAAAFDHGLAPQLLLVGEEALGKAEVTALLARAPEPIVRLLPLSLLAALSELASPPPVMAVIAIPTPPATRHDGDSLLLDGVQDATNVGAALRVAAAAGLRQALLGRGCAGAWTPRALRAGQGAQFALAIHENADLATFLSHYRGQTVAAVAHAGESLYALDLCAPTAWVMGSEGAGIRPAVLAKAARRATIPLASGVESLNVATAAAICLFEMRRQRLASKME